METMSTQSTNVFTQITEMAAARQENREQLVSLYCQERLLYRLSVSSYNDQFYLAGDLLLFALTEGLVKPTKEITLLAKPCARQQEIVKQALKEICSIAVPEDGIEWNAEKIESALTEDGIHFTIPATLGQTTTYIEVRITYKESVPVTPKTIMFPTLLASEVAVLYTYPTEFVIAQKFIEMYQYPALEKTSKAKLEVNQLLQTQNIEGRILQAYIEALFERHHFTIELNTTLELTGVLKQFFSPIHEVLLAEHEFFQQWHFDNQAWQ